MVRLTRAVVLKGISRVSVDKKDALLIDEQFGKVTSLHLQAKNIDILDSLKLFTSLTNLYLYENQIRVIDGLQYAYNLENLYLQRNKIERIENLEHCHNLRKLYLGYNEIQVVEGLEELRNLTELHVEYQRLPKGTSLVFSPMTLATLSSSLLLLDISGNQITTIEDVASMDRLDTLHAMDNRLEDLDDTILITSTLRFLRILDLKKNPITKDRKYKEKIIGYGENIEVLDGKDISDITRDFIKRFCNAKAVRLERAVKKYGQKAAEQIAAQGDIHKAFRSSDPTSSYVMSKTVQSESEPPDRYNASSKEFTFSTPTVSSPHTVGTVYPNNEEWLRLFQAGKIPADAMARMMLPENIPVPDFVLRQSTVPTSANDEEQQEQAEGNFDSFSTNEETEDTDENIKMWCEHSQMGMKDSGEPQIIQIPMDPQTPNSEKEGDDVTMSEMAKVIFRLSNMSSPMVNRTNLPKEKNATSVWMKPGESLPETRPLTPIDRESPLSLEISPGVLLSTKPPSPTKRTSRPGILRKMRSAPKVDSQNLQTPSKVESSLDNNPPFITSVVELPPWPHITKRMGAGTKKITFMP